ncbi:uracil phosphoribosyltransferase [Streptomyces levis]|uniref:uracil phosphoribosyltransferase n=1 Tax=Streptomyces levis TaxID=285566 RepID=UPI003C7C7145
MAEIHKVESKFTLAQAGIVRSDESESGDVRTALRILGEEVGRRIAERYYIEDHSIVTPVRDEMTVPIFVSRTSAVVTTKEDLDPFGAAVASVLRPAALGYMNFEGRRGVSALREPIREIELPDLDSPIDFLVVAKAVLATGCTAVSLTKTAVQEYAPDKVVVASAFYSINGVHELLQAFPHSSIFVVGEPDEMDGNGILHPGVGLLDERI